MWKLLKVILISLMAVSVSGCEFFRATNPDGTVNTTVPDAVAFVKAVKAAAVRLCGFEPLLEVGMAVVAQMLAVYFPAGMPLADAAANVARALCEAPTVGEPGARTDRVTKIVQTPRGTIAVSGRFVGQGARRK